MISKRVLGLGFSRRSVGDQLTRRSKMITEKPSWIRHEGLQIFSIDVQPGGLRFATGGGDQKVRFLAYLYLSILFKLPQSLFIGLAEHVLLQFFMCFFGLYSSNPLLFIYLVSP